MSLFLSIFRQILSALFYLSVLLFSHLQVLTIQNLYALLGNDVEDEEVAPAPMPKEIVKKTTSSKKADVAPASADPARAKKNKKPVTGNEAALKDKANNKSVPAPAGGSKREKKPFDRHSRTGKTDSKKKVAQGWGDDRREGDDEAAGLADAAAEIAAEAKEEPAAPAGKSLKEYLAEQQQLESALGAKSAARKANEGAEDKWTSFDVIQKETQAFVEATSGKKVRQRAPKEKKLLDFTASFGEEAPKFNGKKIGFKGKKAAPKPAAINDQTFPSL